MRSVKRKNYRVLKNGGKPEENPFPDGITKENIVSLLDDYYNEVDRLFEINDNNRVVGGISSSKLDINPFAVTPYPFDYITNPELESLLEDYLSDDAEKLKAFKKGMQSYKSGDYQKGVPDTESDYDAFLKAFGQSFEETMNRPGYGNHPIFPDELNRGAADLLHSIRNRFGHYQFAPKHIMKPLGIGEPYQGQEKLPIQSSSSSLLETGQQRRQPKLIMKQSNITKTGQVPNYYVYYDSKGNPKRRPVEPEEYDRYVRENKR